MVEPPSLALYLVSAPVGFVAGVKTLGALAESANVVLRDLARRVLHDDTLSLDLDTSDDFLKLTHTGLANVTPDELRNGVRALQYVFGGARLTKAGGEDLAKALPAHTDMADAVVQVCCDAWSAQAGEGNDSRSSFTVGQLEGMEWKLGVAMSASTCKKLATPFVTLKLKVSDSAGVPTGHSVELSLAQFQSLNTTLRDVQRIMDST